MPYHLIQIQQLPFFNGVFTWVQGTQPSLGSFATIIVFLFWREWDNETKLLRFESPHTRGIVSSKGGLNTAARCSMMVQGCIKVNKMGWDGFIGQEMVNNIDELDKPCHRSSIWVIPYSIAIDINVRYMSIHAIFTMHELCRNPVELQ